MNCGEALAPFADVWIFSVDFKHVEQCRDDALRGLFVFSNQKVGDAVQFGRALLRESISAGLH